MDQLSKKPVSHEECVSSYDLYAQEVRGLAASTREIQRRILRRFCAFRFDEGPVVWSTVCFTDIVRFLTAEFEHYPNRGTQRASLTSMRTLLRYLAEKNMVPKGWDEALPRTTTRRHAHLPRKLSQDQVRALFRASQGTKWIARRDRALLLLFLRLGLRCEEVAHLKWEDVDWQAGSIRICSQKSRRERILPLPEDVGTLRGYHADSFFTNTLCRPLIYNPLRYTFRQLLKHVGITPSVHQRRPTLHSFRHTFAVKRLTLWQREGIDIRQQLPRLSVYLGHYGPESTYWYLSATPDLLQDAGALFDPEQMRTGGDR